MPAQGSYAFVSPIASTDTSLPFAKRDALLNGDNDGVRFLFDLGFPYSYPGGPYATRPAAGNPAQRQAIHDVSDRANGALVYNAGGSAPTYAGGGFDLTGAITGTGSGSTGIQAPASALADIWNAVEGVSQRFMVVGYFKLPTTANWNGSGAIMPIMSADGPYTSEADLVTISQRGGSPYQIDARRQVAANTLEVAGGRLLQPGDGDYGGLAQIAYFRNAAGSAFTMRTANGRVSTSQTVYADNTQNFSGKSMTWGYSRGFSTSASGTTGFRLYRGWLENLARSDRDPLTVLDADWARVIARGVFS